MLLGNKVSKFNNYLNCGFDLCQLSEAIFICIVFRGMFFVHCLELEVVCISEVENLWYYQSGAYGSFVAYGLSVSLRVRYWRFHSRHKLFIIKVNMHYSIYQNTKGKGQTFY